MSELHTKFTAIYGKLQKGCSDLTQDELVATIALLEQCGEMISSEALFSKNEELDDVQTESLKVDLLSPFVYCWSQSITQGVFVVFGCQLFSRKVPRGTYVNGRTSVQHP